MLPPKTFGRPIAVSRWLIRLEVVLLPLLPVTPTVRAAWSAIHSAVPWVTGIPRRRSSTSHGWVCGTPGRADHHVGGGQPLEARLAGDQRRRLGQGAVPGQRQEVRAVVDGDQLGRAVRGDRGHRGPALPAGAPDGDGTSAQVRQAHGALLVGHGGGRAGPVRTRPDEPGPSMACAQRAAPADGRLHLPVLLDRLRHRRGVVRLRPDRPGRRAAVHRGDHASAAGGAAVRRDGGDPRPGAGAAAPRRRGQLLQGRRAAPTRAAGAAGRGRRRLRHGRLHQGPRGVRVPQPTAARARAAPGGAGRHAEPPARVRQLRPSPALGGRRRQGLDRQPGGAAPRRAGPGAVLGQPEPRDRRGQRGVRAGPAGRPAAARPGAVRAERGRRAATGTSRSPRSTR